LGVDKRSARIEGYVAGVTRGGSEQGGVMPADKLTVQDHTLVVGAVMDNVFRIAAELDVLAWIAGKRKRPTHQEILDTTVNLKSIDLVVRSKLRTAMDIRPKLREAFDALPKAYRGDLEEAFELLVGSRSMKGLRRNLDRIERQHSGTPLAESAKVARSLLDDGKDSIYDTRNNPFYRIGGRDKSLPSVVFSTKGVIKADIAGGFLGAAAGAATGPAIGGAAAAGAIGASTAVALGDLLDELWPEDVELFDDIEHYI
jgi:hypothetical protein